MPTFVGDLVGAETVAARSFSSGVGGSLTYTQTVLADSPVGYYRLGEPSGTSAADAGSLGTAGVYVAAPTLAVAGAIFSDANTAVTFDGISQRVTIGASTITGTDNWTLECWVKCASWAGNKSAVSFGVGGTNGAHIWFQAGAPRGLNAAGGGLTDAAAALSINTWYHVVLRRLTGTNSVWVNGTQYDPGTNNTATHVAPGASSEIGDSGAANWFAGTIDEAAFYTTPLSAARILAHYNKGATGT
jgi:hypothetical protein